MMVAIGMRNGIALPYPDAESARKAYQFNDLQSFLDIYYRSTAVLLTGEDFYDLTIAYLRKAAASMCGMPRSFSTPRAIPQGALPLKQLSGELNSALVEANSTLDISTKLIMCILRHLSEREGMDILEKALPWKRWITGIGLDSSERGNPPVKFRNLFERAHREGFLTVAHAGEEGKRRVCKRSARHPAY